MTEMAAWTAIGWRSCWREMGPREDLGSVSQVWKSW
jgi:hypothetical protein